MKIWQGGARCRMKESLNLLLVASEYCGRMGSLRRMLVKIGVSGWCGYNFVLYRNDTKRVSVMLGFFWGDSVAQHAAAFCYMHNRVSFLSAFIPWHEGSAHFWGMAGVTATPG